MKKLLIFICILLTILSCGCTAADPENKGGSDTTDSGLEASTVNSFEEVTKKYPDKTVLVWAIEGYIQSMKTSVINEYLDSLGCDFAVCFLPLDNDGMYGTVSHIMLINKMLEDGGQMDIISSGSVSIGIDDCTNSYHSLVEDGVLIPLDDYLADTEIGRKLYSLMPEKHWEGLKVSGQIYGVDGSMHTLSYCTGYTVDKAIADKYGFDINVSPCEQLDIIAEIAKEHTVCYNLPFNIPEIYAPVYAITDAVYWDNSENKAKCILENEDYLQTLKAYYILRKNGFVSEYSTADPFIRFEGNKHGSASAYDRYAHFDCHQYITPTWSATGISASSKYPNKAFELLALCQTDPYLNNLLVYGVEGEDYTLVDGKPDTVRYLLKSDTFANKLICLQDKDSPADVSEIYRQALENAEILSCNGFTLHERDIIETINKTDNFFMIAPYEFGKMLNSDSYESFEALIGAAKAKLDEYGMKELTDEINRQYKEWRNENK